MPRWLDLTSGCHGVTVRRFLAESCRRLAYRGRIRASVQVRGGIGSLHDGTSN